ncbi:MAG: N-(5'-phosphoribosyl)anthranilate isomerase [Elusimicrobia bacterium HGW-Elusimicrobia-1]|jgi:phosphoribosylanthranilate isomerase|nr:MAG: N-(5'-phosphoribosyl)anthranilate isomerase [Elusimicrobia bacterium HGW-Elusimicrobia-1]
MLKVKICGITNLDDAKMAASMGYDYVGMVFHEPSPRNVSAATAKKIADAVRGIVSAVGVFVDAPPENVLKISKKCGLAAVQLHGNESVEYCAALKESLAAALTGAAVIKAFAAADGSVIERLKEYMSVADYILLDAPPSGDFPGGTGETFDWAIAAEAVKTGAKIFLAGGLNPTNLAEAVEKSGHPYAVDVSSGLERLPRRKDYDKMMSFIRTAKKL